LGERAKGEGERQGGFILTKNEVFVGVVRPLPRMKQPWGERGIGGQELRVFHNGSQPI
jgi:hypothetical protein